MAFDGSILAQTVRPIHKNVEEWLGYVRSLNEDLQMIDFAEFNSSYCALFQVRESDLFYFCDYPKEIDWNSSHLRLLNGLRVVNVESGQTIDRNLPSEIVSDRIVKTFAVANEGESLCYEWLEGVPIWIPQKARFIELQFPQINGKWRLDLSRLKRAAQVAQISTWMKGVGAFSIFVFILVALRVKRIRDSKLSQ
jgi:hypothetical protein